MPYLETEADFRQVAPTHLANAFRLLERPLSDLCPCTRCEVHIAGAMYLAGYAVECIVKAYVTRSLGKTYWDEVVRELNRRGVDVKGGRGHDLPALLNASGLHLSMPHTIAADYAACSTWSPEWRYRQGTATHTTGVQFVQAAERVYRWVLAQP